MTSRVYLNVTYDEKEEAKCHGARWCPDKRKWWVPPALISSNPGLYKWMQAGYLAALSKASDDFINKHITHRKAPRKRKERIGPIPVTTQQRTFNLPDCDCLTPPWEDCEHTARPETPELH